MKWINRKEQAPDPEDANKILAHNGDYAFECEYEDGYWCNVCGDDFTHWMPLPEPPKPESESQEGLIEQR